MSWVTKHDWNIGEKYQVVPHRTDMNCFRVIKTRQPFSCGGCGKKIPKGTFSYGSEWTRICLGCGEDLGERAIQSFKEIIEFIKSNQKKLEKNKDKWEAENSLASL